MIQSNEHPLPQHADPIRVRGHDPPGGRGLDPGSRSGLWSASRALGEARKGRFGVRTFQASSVVELREWCDRDRSVLSAHPPQYINNKRNIMIRKILFGVAGMLCATLAFITTPALAETWQCGTVGQKICRWKFQNKGQHRFTLPNGLSVQCRKVRAEGQLEGRKKDLQAVPEFRECTVQIEEKRIKVPVEVKGCEIRFTLVKQNKTKEATEAQGEVSIKNTTTTCQITLKLPNGCELRVKAQGPLAKFRAKQVGTRKAREVQVQIEIQVQVKANSVTACGFKKAEERARYKGRGRITSPRGIKIR